MIDQSQFQLIKQLYQGSNTQVFQAIRLSDNKKVILKTASEDLPSVETLTRLHHEYALLSGLEKEITDVIHVYDLISSQNTLILVAEDFGAPSLASYLPSTSFNKEGSQQQAKAPFDFKTNLTIAIQLSRVLKELHQQNIIHKDLNPANILWHKSKQQIKLIDFGISSLIPKEQNQYQNYTQLEGTYAYLSPEQTGRVNRDVDYRCDLYSLGASLYHLFTGRLPFEFEQSIELVHAHIANTPIEPHQIDASIPPILSKIILKLMSKMAEDRYQSAAGLEYDLNLLAQQYDQQTSIGFSLASKDFSSSLQIIQKLYGREEQTAKIMDTFSLVSQGSSELLLISGYSGTGKTALVQQLHKPLTEKNGLYIDAKFDQYQADVPFSAWQKIVRQIVLYILKESEEKLSLWKADILAALGNIGQILIDFVPELELIIGQQSPVPELSGEQALNRFNYVLTSFIKNIANKQHPLVIFIDDWQWADIGSINLLKVVMHDVDIKYFFCICAWRDNEVANTHSYALALKEIKQTQVNITTIQVDNLKSTDINALLSDSLATKADIQPLVSMLYEKTQGNAFFLIQFIKKIAQQGLIFYNHELQSWSWNLEKIEEKNISDNVIHLMTNAILELPGKTQTALQYAACIGNQFDLQTLAIILNLSAKEVSEQLQPGLQHEIILPLSSHYHVSEKLNQNLIKYHFIHDRVQQAAYNLIDQGERKQAHLQISQILLKKLSPKQQHKHIFEIINHLNNAGELFFNSPEGDDQQAVNNAQQVFVKLNIQAGMKAQHATAYLSALGYYQAAISHLQNDAWQNDLHLCQELYLLAAETAFLNQQYEFMESCLKDYLQYADTPLLKANALEIQLQAYVSQNRLNDAVDTALSALSLLGVTMPKQPSNVDIMINLLKTKWAIRGKNFDDLLSTTAVQEPNRLKIMRLLGLTIPPAYWTSPNLVILTVFQMLRESLQYGYSPNTGYAYSWWGITQGAILGDLNKGYEFGEFAIKIAKEYDLNLQQPLFFKAWMTQQFKRPLKESIPVLQKAYSVSLEKGDYEYASYALNNEMQARFNSGEYLNDLCELMPNAHHDLLTFKLGSSLYWNDICWQMALNFNEIGNQNESSDCFLDKGLLKGKAYNEEKELSQHLQVNDASTLFLLYHSKLMLSVFFGNDTKALEYAQQARLYLKAGVGMYAFVLFHFYESIILLKNLVDKSLFAKEKILLKVRANLKKLKHFADASPENHQHRWHLIKAQYLVVRQANDKAMQHYDLAIELADKNSFIHEQALAYELTARFHQSMNRNHLCFLYLKEALNAYQQWGGFAKVNQLQQELKQFKQKTNQTKITSTLYSKSLNTHSKTSSSNVSGTNLDLSTLMKTSQAISSIIVLDELLNTLLNNMMENAGAENGYLLLKKNQQLTIVARRKVEQAKLIQNNEVKEALDQEEDKTNDKVELLSIDIDDAQDTLAASLIYFVERTNSKVVIDNATLSEQFNVDPYIKKYQPKSLLCLPILQKGKLSGILYMENNVTEGAFTHERIELLDLLTTQAAISIENSTLYSHLEEQVAERTKELKVANAKLAQQANIDSLTKLSNRRNFDDLFYREYHRSAREHQALSLLMTDIDNFKGYNDHYGHIEGDYCLQQVANVLPKTFNRATDICARYGGEEFIAVLPLTNKKESLELAEKLRQKVQNLNIPHLNNNNITNNIPENTPNNEPVVTISVGLYHFIPNIEQSIDSVIKKVDSALYKAKLSGRNKVVFIED
ncbi:MAG: diguanylate cyclase [Gammaproteobacteria bacterium]|nr:diguanylate cyclase [Gammaproteobacteria bacterium]